MSEVKKSLNRAVEAKDLHKAISVISQNPILLSDTIAGVPIIHFVCNCDFPELIPELTNLGCSVDALDTYGYPPIYFACSEGFVEVVKTLLDQGADVDGLRKIGVDGYVDETTPLVRAVRNGHIDTVRLLVSHGASINVREFGVSLLDLAKPYPEIEKLLSVNI